MRPPAPSPWRARNATSCSIDCAAAESPELYYEIQSLNDYGAESLNALRDAVERVCHAVHEGDAAAGTVDHCLVVRSDSVHRIQEVQSAVVFELWQLVQSLSEPVGAHGH